MLNYEEKIAIKWSCALCFAARFLSQGTRMFVELLKPKRLVYVLAIQMRLGVAIRYSDQQVKEKISIALEAYL